MYEISIIIPVYNGEKWVDRCMESISSQSILTKGIDLEIAVYNDGSLDNTQSLLEKWRDYFVGRGVSYVLTSGSCSKGVGAAKNAAVNSSKGEFLCFQDIDDVMHPDRVLSQWEVAKLSHNTLVGSRISREPANSTPRLVNWANNLTNRQLKLQIYTSNGPTLLMPTWFCHRSVYTKVGGFNESGAGTPEDLIFFYDHLDANGDLQRVDKELVVYTYHEGATTFSIQRDIIFQIQLKRLENHILKLWPQFTVWNAGKAGRHFVRSLTTNSLQRVIAFCDVDNNKIGRTIELYCSKKRKVISRIPVFHFTQAKPPIIICVKLDLTKGEFERNLSSLNLKEGEDYIFFN